MIDRSTPNSVALETTLLVHGVPRDAAPDLAHTLAEIVRSHGAVPAPIGILDGVPIVGMNDEELARLLDAEEVPKINTANLGIALHRGTHGATTVGATMELAARAGIRVFATGGLGGVHRDAAARFDVSSDLGALTRYPVAVVASGVKSILDVESTREVLETLGIPVIGFGTDRFPSFYFRESHAGVDARFDDPGPLAAYLRAELDRTGRGIVVANPIAPEHELDIDAWDTWVSQAERRVAAAGVRGRAVTPAILSQLHAVSGHATLRANVELVKGNAALAADLAAR